MRVVVSMTTIPSRPAAARAALASVLTQDRKPDAVYLHLPKFCRRTGTVYLAFEPLAGVTVVSCDDRGSATKLFGALPLEQDPETLIVTADDDVEQDPRWLRRLESCARRFPDAAVGFAGWNLNAAGKVLWNGAEEHGSPNPMPVDVLEGYRGAAYRRRFFDLDVLDQGGVPDEMTMCDDVWISGYLARRGIQRLSCWFLDERHLTPHEAWDVVWKHRADAPDALGRTGDPWERAARMLTWLKESRR